MTSKLVPFAFSALVLAFLPACAGPSPAPAPSPTPEVVIHPAPKPPKYIADDLLPEFRKKLELPPAAGSTAQKADEEELRMRQKTRSTEDCRRAESEVHVGLANFFGGDKLITDEQVATLADDFEQFRNDTDYYIQALKKAFPRPRPFTYIQGLEPCVPREVTGAYPSGHAAIARLYALVLTDLYPKQKKAFAARAEVIATDRVTSGMHHPTDVRAGKKLGELVYAKLKASPAYRAWLKSKRAAPRVKPTAR